MRARCAYETRNVPGPPETPRPPDSRRPTCSLRYRVRSTRRARARESRRGHTAESIRRALLRLPHFGVHHRFVTESWRVLLCPALRRTWQVDAGRHEILAKEPFGSPVIDRDRGDTRAHYLRRLLIGHFTPYEREGPAAFLGQSRIRPREVSLEIP